MKNYLTVLSLLLLTSCAWVPWGTHEKLSVTSDPPGAEVSLSSGEHGVTPAQFVKHRWGENFTVTITKAGYAPQTVQVESKGSSLNPNPVSVQLLPRSKSKASRRPVISSSEGRPRTKAKAPAASPTPESSPKPERTPEAEASPTPPPMATPEVSSTPETTPSPESSPSP